jgi:hypothetical protein
MVRYDQGIAGEGGGNAGAVCSGSLCMMWRWTFTPLEAAVHEEQRKTWRVDPGVKPAEGYCGLAGRP